MTARYPRDCVPADRLLRPRPRFGGALLHLWLWACGILLSGGCLLRAGPGETPLVGKVQIEGNQALADGDLVGKLVTGESGYRAGITLGSRNVYDPDIVELDARRIERVYAAQGYLDARVTDIKTSPSRGRIDVTFVVTEGKPTHVASVEVTGLESLDLPTRAALLTGLPLNVGEIATEEAYDALKALLLDRLRARGHWEATLEGRLQLDQAQARALVRVDTHPGPQYRLSRVTVFGAQNVSRDRIAQATGAESGTLLTPALLSEVQRRIYALGVFSNVRAEPGPLDRTQGRTTLVVTVQEAPFQTLELGAGVDLDPTRQAARVRALYVHRNLNRGLLRLRAGGSAGWAFLPTVWSALSGEDGRQGPVADLGIELTQPRFLRRPIDISAGIDYGKELTQAFAYQRVGVRVSTPFALPAVPGLLVSPSLNLEQYFDVATDPGSSAVAGTSLSTNGCSPSVGTASSPACGLFYLQLRLNYDRRDNQISARRGVFLSTAVDWAGGPLSDFRYVRLSPEARTYIPVGKTGTLALRLRGGWLQEAATGSRPPPGFARFFAGGANSVRATAAQQLGPRAFVVQDAASFDPTLTGSSPYAAATPIPLGGDRLVEGSAEFRWRTPVESLSTAVFWDQGRVWVADAPNLGGGSQYGPGLGFRYFTPFGPLRVDLAWRMSDLDQSPARVQAELAPQVDSNGNVVRGGLDLLTRGSDPPDPVRHPPTSADPGEYRIRTACSGAPAPFCFAESRLQFFLTLGEAF